MLGVIQGLMRLIGSATRIAAATPMIDAAVALVPGLAAQSLMKNNFELRHLRQGLTDAPPGYFAVQSNFEPTDPGWKFWRYFIDAPIRRVADLGADVVFPSANDLVVDTSSMTELALM